MFKIHFRISLLLFILFIVLKTYKKKHNQDVFVHYFITFILKKIPMLFLKK